MSAKKNTPPENGTLGKISFQSAKPEAGEQFLPLDRRAKAHLKGVFFHRHRYDGEWKAKKGCHAVLPVSVKKERSFSKEPLPRNRAADAASCNSFLGGCVL